MALSSALELANASKPSAGPWRQVGIFYLLAMALSLAVWIPAGAQLAGVLPGRVPALLVLASQYSPTLAALILIWREGGLAGLGRFLSRSLNPMFDPRWYAVALLTPLLMGLGLIALHAFRGGYVPPFLSAQDVHDHIVRYWTSIQDASGGASRDVGVALARWSGASLLQTLAVYFAVCLANGGISEEAGWRGYALARLLEGRRVLTAALIVGFFWGLWHTGPAFWAAVFGRGTSGFAIPVEYTLGTIPLTVMISWVFVNAKRSLLPGMLFHACYNGTFFFLTQIWTPGHPAVSILEWLAASYVAALLVVAIGAKTMFARTAQRNVVDDAGAAERA